MDAKGFGPPSSASEGKTKATRSSKAAGFGGKPVSNTPRVSGGRGSKTSTAPAKEGSPSRCWHQSSNNCRYGSGGRLQRSRLGGPTTEGRAGCPATAQEPRADRRQGRLRRKGSWNGSDGDKLRQCLPPDTAFSICHRSCLLRQHEGPPLAKHGHTLWKRFLPAVATTRRQHQYHLRPKNGVVIVRG